MDLPAGYATAKEFRFYENYAVKSKEIESWSVNTDSAKKQYQVGNAPASTFRPSSEE